METKNKPKKRRVWAWLLMWFIMPFTAFMELEKLFTDEDDPRDMDDDPNLSPDAKALPGKDPWPF